MKPSRICLLLATLLNEASKSIIMDNFRADLHKKSFNFTHLFHLHNELKLGRKCNFKQRLTSTFFFKFSLL